MKIKFLFLVVMFFLQSCHVPLKRDYQGLSGALVFTQNKKWLVNNLYLDLDSFEKERLNKKIILSTPKMISRKVSVNKLIQICGCAKSGNSSIDMNIIMNYFFIKNKQIFTVKKPIII
jgi:hypothetical protein